MTLSCLELRLSLLFLTTCLQTSTPSTSDSIFTLFAPAAQEFLYRSDSCRHITNCKIGARRSLHDLFLRGKPVQIQTMTYIWSSMILPTSREPNGETPTCLGSPRYNFFSLRTLIVANSDGRLRGRPRSAPILSCPSSVGQPLVDYTRSERRVVS